MSRIVIVLGLYQGAVPLVVRAAFGGDQRFAPALWLPSPWWWIACLAVVAAAIAVAAVLEDSGTGEPAQATESPAEPAGQDGPVAGYDAVSAVVFLVGVYNGIVPFVARLVFDGDPVLAFTLLLPSPWWWIVSLVVIAVAVVLLDLVDTAKQRRLSR